MPKPIDIQTFIRAIERLPSDPPIDNPNVWYVTQKQHWLGWLGAYHTAGAYGRANTRRDARFAYNHIVNYQMLDWLMEAAGIDAVTVAAARDEAETAGTMQGKSGVIRRHVPWEMMRAALWPASSSRRSRA